MNWKRTIWLPLVAAGMMLSGASGVPFADGFQAAKLTDRRMMRGDWKVGGGVATCTQDDALYAKNKNHGPIIWYDVPFQDGVVKFSYQTKGSKTFVFTANGKDGHVFRFVTNEAGTDLRAFPPEQKTPPSIALSKGGPKLAVGEWTDVVVELRGTKATVKIGKGYEKTVEHVSLGRGKANIGLGFSFGTMTVRNFSIQP